MQDWHKAQKKKEAAKNRKIRQQQRAEKAKDEDIGMLRGKVRAETALQAHTFHDRFLARWSRYAVSSDTQVVQCPR